MTSFFTMNAAVGSGMSVQRAIESYNRSMPPASEQSIMAAFAVMFIIIVAGSIYLFGNGKK